VATELDNTRRPIDPGLTRRALRDGEVVAYTQLVRLLEPRLRRHAARLLGSDRRSEVDDLLQETLERVHRAAAHIDEDRPVEAWAYAIMRNLCLDWHRAAGRQPQTASALPEGIDVSQPRQGDSGQQGDGSQDGALFLDLRNALLQLPLGQRRLIELVYFKGFPLTEGASRLNMTYPAARYQLTAALRQLRAAIDLQESETYPTTKKTNRTRMPNV
jgi:RNA polymerase sigma-70 factor (ECF subfamily)